MPDLLAADGPRRPREDLPACTGCGATWKACKGVRWLRGRECCAACDGHDTRAEAPADAP